MANVLNIVTAATIQRTDLAGWVRTVTFTNNDTVKVIYVSIDNGKNYITLPPLSSYSLDPDDTSPDDSSKFQIRTLYHYCSTSTATLQVVYTFWWVG